MTEFVLSLMLGIVSGIAATYIVRFIDKHKK